MDKEVREISYFFVAPPSVFAPPSEPARNHTIPQFYTAQHSTQLKGEYILGCVIPCPGEGKFTHTVVVTF